MITCLLYSALLRKHSHELTDCWLELKEIDTHPKSFRNVIYIYHSARGHIWFKNEWSIRARITSDLSELSYILVKPGLEPFIWFTRSPTEYFNFIIYCLFIGERNPIMQYNKRRDINRLSLSLNIHEFNIHTVGNIFKEQNRASGRFSSKQFWLFIKRAIWI